MPDQSLQPTDMPVNDLAFNELFNYASFMWDDNMSAMDNASNLSPTQWSNMESNSLQGMTSTDMHPATYMGQQSSRRQVTEGVAISKDATAPMMTTIAVTTLTPTSAPDDNELTEYFVRSDAPPILAPVETRFRWSSMKKIFTQMSSTSRMVRYAVLAFSAVQLEESTTNWKENYVPHYEKSKEELSDFMLEASNDHDLIKKELQHVLAVLFLLSYVDVCHETPLD